MADAYDLVVDPVAEVCLVGTVSASWAEGVLAPEGLTAAVSDGRVRAQLCATHARFGGRAFSEAVFSVDLADGGVFLVSALESLRMYAWVERTRNKSPYVHGRVLAEQGATVSIATAVGGEPVFDAAGPAVDGAPAPGAFEGVIHQPGGTCFDARLAGTRATRAFGAEDTFHVGGAGDLGAALAASAFAPTAWSVATDAVHAKNDTRACATR